MARAAVIPQSPTKRAGRTSTKSTAAADAKRKAPRKAAPVPRTAAPALDADSDDELGLVTSKPTKPSGRPVVKPKLPAAARGKKVASAPVVEESKGHNDRKDEPGQQLEVPKKRVGRPRKAPPPPEATAPKTKVASRPRGRPRGESTTRTPLASETATTSRRARTAVGATNETKPNTIRIATNSTTMRSNLLRGPAKKKTVTFQELPDSEADSEPEVPPAGRRRVASKTASVGKTGLGAAPARKSTTTATRGRKPAAAKKAVTQPLSPKKAKQVAKSLSAYASSDGEDDELNTIKDDLKDTVKLVIHSPVRHGLENTGLSSPVRRINFTPKKASSFMDENGEPKLPTPKHGSEGTSLSSPVRKINFTPNRSQNAMADNCHLALPPGNSIEFSDSMFMSSPARRAPQSSPFRFSLRDTRNRGGSLFRDSVNPITAPEFTPELTSPLKMSPKKGLLGASFSQSINKTDNPAPLARTPLFQSPAKRITSPFKNSIFSAHVSVSESKSTDHDGTPSKTAEPEQSTTPKSSPRESLHDEAAFEKDTEMVENVARDIFGIELSSESKASTNSPVLEDNPATAEFHSSDIEDNTGYIHTETEFQTEEDPDIDENENENFQDNDEEVETMCFDILEDANMPIVKFDDYEVSKDSGPDASEKPEEQPQFEYEEADTICFDAMEEAQMAMDDLHDHEVDEESDSEQSEPTQEDDQFEHEELDTICFDAMEDAHLAEHELHEQETEVAELAMDNTSYSGEEMTLAESEIEEQTPQMSYAEPQELLADPLQDTEMQDLQNSDEEGRAKEISSPSSLPLKTSSLKEVQPSAVLDYPIENEEEGQEDQEEILGNFDDEEQIINGDSDIEDTQPTPIRSELSTISSQYPSPHRSNHVEDIATPPQEKQATLSPLPSPAVDEFVALSLNYPDNTGNDHGSTLDAKNANNVSIDMPLHEENGRTPNTRVDSPALMAPSLFNTPSVVDQRQSPAETTLGFTPLAQKFSRWEQNTPSQARSLRPRRRGVFSLVGPLDRINTESPATSSGVSYPDLSKSPLLNTPSLFAQLPLQPQSDDSCLSPEHVQTRRPSSIYANKEVNSSTSKATDIFEDSDSDFNEAEHTFVTESPHEQDREFHLIDDKENCGPEIAPSTPMKYQGQLDDLRTVHTVSKVPLKAEGEESPLKLPRKRGLSLSSTSPTRSSPRIRKSPFMPLGDSAPVLSPTRKSPRMSRNLAPKGRSTAARRSCGKPQVMDAPSVPAATASPAKKSRRSISTEQKALQGAVVHVDVHTTEGEDASGIFVELLQQMGARCVKSWSWNPRTSLSPADDAEPKDFRVGITHVVYKDGGLRTLEKVKKAAGLVKCVGVGWVLDCERENQWLDETPYAVDSSIIPRGGAKRRKSMEPRALSNVNGTLVRVPESPASSTGGRRSGVNAGAVEGFRKITPPTHHQQMPSTPPKQSSTDSYQFPATPGYNFANLDAIGMSPATPGFLGNRSKLIQQSCPPKQTNRGLFPGTKITSRVSDEGDDEESRRQRRFRMEAARRKSLVYKPAVGSPLVP